MATISWPQHRHDDKSLRAGLACRTKVSQNARAVCEEIRDGVRLQLLRRKRPGCHGDQQVDPVCIEVEMPSDEANVFMY